MRTILLILLLSVFAGCTDTYGPEIPVCPPERPHDHDDHDHSEEE